MAGTMMRVLSEAQQFGIRFFALLLLASVGAWAVTLPTRLETLQRAIAVAAGFLANFAGATTVVEGQYILTGGLAMHVTFECTGIYVLIILIMFLLAYPASWKARLAGVALGAVGLQLINVFRISLLARLAELNPSLFDYFHEYVWQGLFLVLVIAYAMYWVEWQRR